MLVFLENLAWVLNKWSLSCFSSGNRLSGEDVGNATGIINKILSSREDIF